jgi:hypothetical protein
MEGNGGPGIGDGSTADPRGQQPSEPWRLGDLPQKAPHETPYGGYTEEQMSLINNSGKPSYANPGSALWAYREKLADKERRKLPHVRRAANLQAIGIIVTCVCTFIGAFPGIDVRGRFILFSLAVVIAIPIILEAWTPVRDMQGLPKLLTQAVIVALGIMLMLALAFWESSFDTKAVSGQKVVIPQYECALTDVEARHDGEPSIDRPHRRT